MLHLSSFFFYFILVYAEKEKIVFVLILGSEVICRRSGVNQKSWGGKVSLGQKQLLLSQWHYSIHGTGCSGQTLFLSFKPPAYLWPWPPRSAHCLCKGFPGSEPGLWVHTRACPGRCSGAPEWGNCPPCPGTVLSLRGGHLWATGTGPERGAWTLHPCGKEERNRENIHKPVVALTNACINNVGLNGNGWRQTAHLLPLRRGKK